MPEDLVENFNLLLIELFIRAQKQVGDASQRFGSFFLGAPANSIFQFGNQRSLAVHMKTPYWSLSQALLRRPLTVCKCNGIAEEFKN